MANHTITSQTAVVSGTCGTAGTLAVTITSASRLHKIAGGVNMYVKYTAGGSTNGTALVITPTVINPSIHATDAYRIADDAGYTGRVYTFATAGNYRINLPIHPREVVVASAVFSGGSAGVAVVDFMDEGSN
jgi:hypothetical protein